MSFDLYFAGSTTIEKCLNYFSENKCCRLFSQYNDRKGIAKYIENPNHGKLFVDSGAYTAYTKGVEIDVDEYIEFINSITTHVTIFAQVDKIPGQYGKPKTKEDIVQAPEISWKNYLYMRDKVLEPDKLLPVFHRREAWKHLDRILSWIDDKGRHIPYIALAPTTDSTSGEKIEWLHQCYERIENSDNPAVKTHLFGVSNSNIVKLFPCTSSDSTTWIKSGIYGELLRPYDAKTVHSDKLLNTDDSMLLKEVIHSLDLLNMTKQDLLNNSYDRLLYNIHVLDVWSKNLEFKKSKVKRRKLL